MLQAAVNEKVEKANMTLKEINKNYDHSWHSYVVPSSLIIISCDYSLSQNFHNDDKDFIIFGTPKGVPPPAPPARPSLVPDEHIQMLHQISQNSFIDWHNWGQRDIAQFQSLSGIQNSTKLEVKLLQLWKIEIMQKVTMINLSAL